MLKRDQKGKRKEHFHPPGEILGDVVATLDEARCHPEPCSEHKSHWEGFSFFIKSSTGAAQSLLQTGIFLLLSECFLGRHCKKRSLFFLGCPRVKPELTHLIPRSHHEDGATEPPTKPAWEGVRTGRTHTHTIKNHCTSSPGMKLG